MAGTIRHNTLEAEPSTQFYMYADQGSQSIENNSSLVAVYLRAINRGDGTSRYLGAGTHRAYVNGELIRNHSGDPFLPSGFADNADRWYEGPYYATVEHNSDGSKTVPLRMYLDYGNVHYDSTVNLKLTKIPRIPYAFRRWTGASEKHALTAVRWDGTKEVALTTAVRWNGTSEESLL